LDKADEEEHQYRNGEGKLDRGDTAGIPAKPPAQE